jgi:hypothetical protein
MPTASIWRWPSTWPVGNVSSFSNGHEIQGDTVMKRIGTIGLVLCAALALSGLAASTTSAAFMFLPEFAIGTGWTGTGDEARLGTASGNEIRCKAATNAGTTEASKKLGTFVLEFTGCTSEKPIAGATCKSRGDAAETILTVGTWHLVLTMISSIDHHLIWLLMAPFVTDCSIFEFKMNGNLLGSITPANALTKVYHIEVNVSLAHRQEFTTFENDSGTRVKASLELNGEVAFEELAENFINMETGTLLIN